MHISKMLSFLMLMLVSFVINAQKSSDMLKSGIYLNVGMIQQNDPITFDEIKLLSDKKTNNEYLFDGMLEVTKNDSTFEVYPSKILAYSDGKDVFFSKYAAHLNLEKWWRKSGKSKEIRKDLFVKATIFGRFCLIAFAEISFPIQSQNADSNPYNSTLSSPIGSAVINDYILDISGARRRKGNRV